MVSGAGLLKSLAIADVICNRWVLILARKHKTKKCALVRGERLFEEHSGQTMRRVNDVHSICKYSIPSLIPRLLIAASDLKAGQAWSMLSRHYVR